MSAAGKKKKQTPVRVSLAPHSNLAGKVEDGIGAVARPHRQYFEEAIRAAFGDSLDLDAALQADHPQENRWDYLLGHNASGKIVGVEPHFAKQDEISTVINKRRATKQQLAGHLKSGARVSKWLWVASGRVHFANTEKARLRLDQNGIEFAGTRSLSKHLPAAKPKKRDRKGRSS